MIFSSASVEKSIRAQHVCTFFRFSRLFLIIFESSVREWMVCDLINQRNSFNVISDAHKLMYVCIQIVWNGALIDFGVNDDWLNAAEFSLFFRYAPAQYRFGFCLSFRMINIIGNDARKTVIQLELNKRRKKDKIHWPFEKWHIPMYSVNDISCSIGMKMCICDSNIIISSFHRGTLSRLKQNYVFDLCMMWKNGINQTHAADVSFFRLPTQ